MGRVCMGRLGNGPSLQWAEFATGQLPNFDMHQYDPQRSNYFFMLAY